MNKFSRIAVAALLLTGCRPGHDRAGVEASMQHMDRLIQKIDADSIAWMYTPDGKLGVAAQGRDSIRAFLQSFKNVRVLSQVSVSDRVSISGDSAYQRGRYFQTDEVNGRDTMKVKGKYEAWWRWQDGRWMVSKMTTSPMR